MIAWLIFGFIALLGAKDLGEFGDFLGSLNTLFSGLAFVGLVVAILLQREDLRKQTTALNLQREELKLQREELAATRQVLDKQHEEMKQSAKAHRDQAKHLKLSARLNMLSTLYEAYNSEVTRLGTNEERDTEKRNQFIKLQKETLDELEAIKTLVTLDDTIDEFTETLAERINSKDETQNKDQRSLAYEMGARLSEALLNAYQKNPYFANDLKDLNYKDNTNTPKK